MKEVSCPKCKFEFLVNDRPKYTSKKLPKFTKQTQGWNCPACNIKHYDVTANICPHCKIDFRSKEFTDVCKQKGVI